MDTQTIALLAAQVGLTVKVHPSAEVLAACAAACSKYPPEVRPTAAAQILGRVFESFSRACGRGDWANGCLTFATRATGRRLFLEAEAVPDEQAAIALRFVAR